MRRHELHSHLTHDMSRMNTQKCYNISAHISRGNIFAASKKSLTRSHRTFRRPNSLISHVISSCSFSRQEHSCSSFVLSRFFFPLPLPTHPQRQFGMSREGRERERVREREGEREIERERERVRKRGREREGANIPHRS